jgi:hypothetical protein
MDRDPLTIIAESYRVSAQTHLLVARTQMFAMVLLGLSLLGTGLLLWQHLATTSQMAAQTQALLEIIRLMRNHMNPP